MGVITFRNAASEVKLPHYSAFKDVKVSTPHSSTRLQEAGAFFRKTLSYKGIFEPGKPEALSGRIYETLATDSVSRVVAAYAAEHNVRLSVPRIHSLVLDFDGESVSIVMDRVSSRSFLEFLQSLHGENKDLHGLLSEIMGNVAFFNGIKRTESFLHGDLGPKSIFFDDAGGITVTDHEYLAPLLLFPKEHIRSFNRYLLDEEKGFSHEVGQKLAGSFPGFGQRSLMRAYSSRKGTKKMFSGDWPGLLNESAERFGIELVSVGLYRLGRDSLHPWLSVGNPELRDIFIMPESKRG